MLQHVKFIIENHQVLEKSEQHRRNGKPENVQQVVDQYAAVKILNANLDILNEHKNRMAKLFKEIKKGPVVYKVLAQIAKDFDILNANTGGNFVISTYSDCPSTDDRTCSTPKDLAVIGTMIKKLRTYFANVIEEKTQHLHVIAATIGNVLDKRVPLTEQETVFNNVTYHTDEVPIIKTKKIDVGYFSGDDKKHRILDCEKLTKKIKKKYLNQCLNIGQYIYLYFSFDDRVALKIIVKNVDIQGDNMAYGILGENTEIKYERSKNTPILLENGGQDLEQIFKIPKFDFQSMGIGGLDKEFANIFRRVFATLVPNIHKTKCRRARDL